MFSFKITIFALIMGSFIMFVISESNIHISSFITRLIGLYRPTVNSEQRLNWCFISGFPMNALFYISTRRLYCAIREEAKVFHIYFHLQQNKLSR